MCYLAAGLENTSSGSILISRARASHLQMSKLVTPPIVNHVPWELEHPDWSILSLKTPSASLPRKMLEKRADDLTESLECSQKLITAQQVINEGANAQLAVMNLTNVKLNESLHVKETRKKTDRTVMYPGGKGRHLTAVEVIEQKRKLEKEKEQEEAEKEQRKAVRGSQKAEKEKLGLQWKEMLEDYAHKVAQWEDNCKKLREQRIMIKDLPKKPKRPLKPKPKQVDNDDVDGEDEDDGEGDGDGY